MVARLRSLITVFRVRVVVVVVSVLLISAVVLRTPGARPAAVFLVNVPVVRARGFALSAVSDDGCLPTPVRRTVVTELSEVRVPTAACVNEGVSTLFE